LLVLFSLPCTHVTFLHATWSRLQVALDIHALMQNAHDRYATQPTRSVE
jgi:hypothetical protein